jgi:hypothetical protein
MAAEMRYNPPGRTRQKEPRVTAGRHLLGRPLRALLGRRRDPPPHTHRLELPPQLTADESVPTGRCACGAVGILLRDLAGPEWAWLSVLAPDQADRVVWLPPEEYEAALHRVSQAPAGRRRRRGAGSCWSPSVVGLRAKR